MPGGHSPFGTRAAPVLGPKALSPGSAHFDGSSSLSLASGVPIANGVGWTLAFWAERTGGVTAPNILTQTTNPTNQFANMFWYGFANGLGVYRPVFYAPDGSNCSSGDTGFGALNQWRCHVITYLAGPGRGTKSWINNIGSVFAGGLTEDINNDPASCPLLVGNGVGDGFGDGAGGLIGNIDSLGIWQTTFTDAMAAEFWNGGAGLDFAGLPADLLPNLYAWYNLNGPQSGKWRDSSGNGHHLSVNGTVTVGPPRNH